MGYQSCIVVIYPIHWRGINHKAKKKKKAKKQNPKNKYMAVTKPAYRIVGLQERKVGGKKRNQSKIRNPKQKRWL